MAADDAFAVSAPVPVVAVELLTDGQWRDIHLPVGSGIFGETRLIDSLVQLLVAHNRPKATSDFGTFTGLAAPHIAPNTPDAHVPTLDLTPADRASAK